MRMKQCISSSTKWLGTLLLLCISSLAYSQSTVSGIVTDANSGEPLIGVNILIKGTGTGTITDIDGNYALELSNPEDILVFSYTGYGTKEVAYNGLTKINVKLGTDVQTLDEIVVIGYGGIKQKEVTGAVASVKSDDIQQTATSDLGTALQGMIAGVNVQASNGRPGEQANIQIRGVGSLSTAALAPLYIVDGIPFEGTPNIAPEQIASVEVLKDGAAAAVYGTRASNGVVLITTKRGKAGDMKVELSSYYGLQNITSGTPLMGAREQIYVEQVKLAAIGRDPLIFFFNPDALDYDTDFVDFVTNDNSPIQSHNLMVSGGQENLTFNINTNYFNQDGVLINSGFERLSTRLNGQFTSGKFQAFASVGLTREETEQEPWALYEYALFQTPWQRPIDQLDNVGGEAVEFIGRNAQGYSFLARTLENEDRRKVNSSSIALNLKYELVKGLNVQVNLGRNKWDYQRKFLQPQYILFDQNGYNASASRENAILQEDYIFTERETIENLLSYEKTFGGHNFRILAGYTAERYQAKNISASVTDLLSNDTPVFNAASEATSVTGFDEEGALTGLIGRLQYNFRDKYLFSASIRRDGSSNFGASNRYGYFPGLSAGWNISDEVFFKDNEGLSFITNMKLRASYGEVGNQSIPRYQYAAIIEPGHDYPFGVEGQENLELGAIQKRYGNENIKWETNISKNLGLDLLLFDGRVNITADVYENSKKDMLLALNLAPSTGTWQPRDNGNIYKSRLVNVGNMVNRGIEIAASYQGTTGSGLNWRVTGTFTRNQNEVTDLGPFSSFAFGGGRPVLSRGERTDFTTYLAQGYEAGAFFLIPTDGVLKTEEDVENYRGLDGGALIGDLRYVDVNGDGAINDLDRVYAGSGQADFESGLALNLQYKGFDFFGQLYYSHGAEIYNGSKLYAYGVGRHKDQYYQWSPQNASSDIPTVRESQEHNNTRARSDFFLEDGTYLRVRNLTLGYTIPQTVFGKGFESLRLYFSAQNPFTFTEYEGYDPEIGGDGIFTRGVDQGNYPVSRRFLIGVQAKFQ